MVGRFPVATPVEAPKFMLVCKESIMNYNLTTNIYHIYININI